MNAKAEASWVARFFLLWWSFPNRENKEQYSMEVWRKWVSESGDDYVKNALLADLQKTWPTILVDAFV